MREGCVEPQTPCMHAHFLLVVNEALEQVIRLKHDRVLTVRLYSIIR